MPFKLVIFLCFWAAVANADLKELKLEADKPLERVALSHEATIRCCYHWNKKPHVTWIINIQNTNGTTMPSIVNQSKDVIEEKDGVKCHLLFFKSVRLNDTGLYQCKLNHDTLHIFTHGTFLQVYKPLQKTLNLSESVKNSIITAEGVLLLMCVLIPGTMLLCKSKRLNELERKKGQEEENIYEGLNLDDCNSAYHQIQRSNQQGPYQDVATCGEDIQLEKP
ncbi:B-cell antigen receptor complex-associated protein alpha chain-like [Sinocyclocheilus anshuiensis]|uniref:B-cell antigen receptor complex-associated protein alpha chain-like n=1 Tax=Sinocyclocheilus anshuiensis TaxID=1608454 RepID=UPI0007B8F39F|nr:PREDICTED: B-cell antigen receptor complex-associated protein alpha chain-like [Sinocyclocheilus anshuiensis]